MVDILYEDNHIIVVIKPQNVLSQSDETLDEDLLSMVKNYIKEKYNKAGNVYVGLVHRLDRPTGGIMVFAKTSKAAARLSAQIVDGEFSKDYLAITSALPREKTGRLCHYLKKDENSNVVSIVSQSETGAKYAELVYEVMEEKESLCLIKINILTGRSHQIRVQMASMKTPLFGDIKYGDKLGKGFNLALWAIELSFLHPITKQRMSFVSYPPENIIPWKYFNLSKFFKVR